MFGTRDDRCRTRESLARSALRAGSGHWTQIGWLREHLEPGEPSFDLAFMQTTTGRPLLPLLLLLIGVLAKKFGVPIDG